MLGIRSHYLMNDLASLVPGIVPGHAECVVIENLRPALQERGVFEIKSLTVNTRSSKLGCV